MVTAVNQMQYIHFARPSATEREHEHSPSVDIIHTSFYYNYHW
jgi:hypothetical protein